MEATLTPSPGPVSDMLDIRSTSICDCSFARESLAIVSSCEFFSTRAHISLRCCSMRSILESSDVREAKKGLKVALERFTEKTALFFLLRLSNVNILSRIY